jgi:biopolymer transport protein ExbD
MNFKKNIGNEQTGFQLAPMVDIMFLLLIFFMVSSIYYQLEKNLEVKVPRAESGVSSERSPGELIINVDKKGSYYINNIKQSLESVEELLRDVVKKHNQTQPVIIRCDKDTAHKYFVKIFDVCQKLEIEDIRIATEPKDLVEDK